MSKIRLIYGLLAGMVCTVPVLAAQNMDPFSVREFTADTQAGSMSTSLTSRPCTFDTPGSASLTLVDVVERALCNNPQTRVAWANARAQAALTGAAKSAYLPALNATASLSRHHTDGDTSRTSDNYTQGSAGVSLTYLLYDFGARGATLENAKQQLAALNAAQDAAIQSVFLSAVRAYYQTFATQAAVEAALEAEKSSAESLKAANVRYGVGAGTRADKLQAQTAHSQAVLNRIRAEGEIRNAQGILANTLGLDAGFPLAMTAPSEQTPSELFEDNVTALIVQARQLRPDLAAAEAQIKAARANVDAARASGMPSVSLSSNLNYTESSDDPSFQSSAVGVSINVPLFSGFNTTYRARAAEAELESRTAQRDRIKQQIALDVWTAYYALVTETQAVRSSADLLDSAAQSARVMLGRYKGGVGSILDLLTAQSALASARQQNIQARYNWRIAKTALAQAMGRLGFDTLAPPQAPPGAK